MKSMMTMMIASLLLASGCASVDVNSDGGYSPTRAADTDILQQLADGSQGG